MIDLPSGLKVIYRPGPRAAEYGEAALNLYTGCPHRCVYCYVPDVVHKTRAQFARVLPRERIIDFVASDCFKLRRAMYPGPVHLCFTCDPYPDLEQEEGITRQAFELLHHAGVAVQVLTKNPTLACRDFDLYGKRDRFGVTLTFADASSSRVYEPGANMPMARIGILKAAHEQGIPTWVSLEPVIDPDQSLQMAEEAIKAGCREFHVGPDNHCESRRRGVAWAPFIETLTDRCRKSQARAVLKHDMDMQLVNAGRLDLVGGCRDVA